MRFDPPPELLELRATVRKIAEDKVAPRAREMDTTATYPQDLFDLFRETGLLGLVIPEEYGGSRAGVLRLTAAPEEGAKYSNTAAPMFLLTPPPPRPVMIAGSAAPEQPHLRRAAAGGPR